MRGRASVIVLILAIVATMIVLDRDVTGPSRPAFGQPEVAPMPTADPDDVLASTWYCAAGTAFEGGPANLTVVVANASEAELPGIVTWYPVDAEPVEQPIDVPASGVVTLAATDAVEAEVVSAVVDVRGGSVGVEHVVSGERGASVAPCAADASPTWYFANGTTERDAQQVLALFNPFPDDAIVDISFDTDEGRDEPAALQGLPVRAGSTSLVSLHENVRRRAVTATAVVARSGRLVVDRIQSFDPQLAGGRRGLALTLGASRLAQSWTFPEGFWTDGLDERWHVFNPGDVDAHVSLELVPTDGDPIEPVDVTVPAKGQVVLVASEIDRVPAGVGHTSSIRSLDGVPVVAERSLDAKAPAPRRGWTSSLGSPLAAARWLFPLGETSGNTDEYVVVHNPSAEDVTVSITALAGGQVLAIDGLQDVELGPGGRIALRIGEHIERSPLPLLVEASADVVVERDLYRVDAPGVTAVIGIPLP